jgi:hypothetical protein
MVRRVAFGKAVLAGAAGALAWEIVARIAEALGLPLFDITHMIGTMFANHAPFWEWWPIGMTLHAIVGAIWAIFYAYFFWSTFDWPPAVQGMVFSIVPAVLAGLVMIPQMALMHPLVLARELPFPGLFASRLGLAGPATDIFGHLIYGAVMGAIYTHPVGRAVVRRATSNG